MDENEVKFDMILNEIALSSMGPYKISTNKMRVDKKTIFLTIPDINIDLYTSIYQAGTLLSNCSGIIEPTKILSMYSKRFSGRVHYKETRKTFITEKVSGAKKIQVIPDNVNLNSLESEEIKNKKEDNIKNYFFYDMTIYVEALHYGFEKFSEKIAIFKFLKELTEIYKNEVKLKYPGYNVEALFLINSKNGILLNIIEQFKNYRALKDFKEFTYFDNFALFSNVNNIIIPFMCKEKGVPKLILQNIEKIKKYVEVNDEKDKIDSTPLVVDTSENIEKKERKTKEFISTSSVKSSKIFSSMIKNLKDSTLSSDIDADGNIKVGINQDQLSELFKKHTIDDPLIINNVQGSINKFIKENGSENLTTVKLEEIVLKTINYTIHQKEELDDEYINNPDKLIVKASNIKNYKVPLEIPIEENSIVDPSKIVDIDYTTGTWRVKYEFEEMIHFNIKKLFETLETTSSSPIQVKKIEYDIVDDDLSRIMEFTVTLQNGKGAGWQDPYQVKLKIPSLVNDRYFKLNGASYIPSTQHFMKVLTKTNKSEVRFLSNYSTVTLSVKALKFNTTEIREIIQYIKVRYKSLIKIDNNTSVIFSDDSILYLSGEECYKDGNMHIVEDPLTNKLKDQVTDIEMNIGRQEFNFEILSAKVQRLNPDDRFTRTKKSTPYICVNIGGKKVPLIIYMWLQMGLMGSLNRFNIPYEVVDLVTEDAKYVVQLKNGKYIAINPVNFRDILICNGLLTSRIIKEKFVNTESVDEIGQYIDFIYGNKSVYNLKTVTTNCIDPITSDLLIGMNYPTNLPAILSGPALNMLLNKDISKLSDLNIYRSRISEICLGVTFKLIKQAQSYFSEKVKTYDDKQAKLILDENYVLSALLEEGVLNYTSSVNPVDELFLSSKTIKTGPGGVPSSNSFKNEHRNVDPSQIGVLSALTTSEDSNVGVVVAHTLTPANFKLVS